MGEVTAPTKIVLFSAVNSKFGAPVLDRLLTDPQISVEALVTSPAGQLCDYYVHDPQQVDLAATARAAGVCVMRPPKVNRDTVLVQLRQRRPDYFIIANYQQIFSEALLGVPEVGTVNFHPSPLPRYAGLAPFFWMARNGEREGGVSAVWTTAGIDSGPLVAQRRLPLGGTETSGEIVRSHFEASWHLVDEVLPTLIDRSLRLTDQDLRERSYYGRPGPQDQHAYLAAPTREVLRTIRACCPDPGATLSTSDGNTLRVLEAEAIHSVPTGPWPQPGTLLEYDGQYLGRTADGWIRLVRMIVSDAVLADCRRLDGNLALTGI